MKDILAAIGAPLALAAVVLFVLCKAYFSMLAFYLRLPEPRMASLAVSAVVAGILIWLLLHAIASMRLARYVGGERKGRWFDFRNMAREARLYTALLRLLLVFAVAAVATGVIVSLAMRHMPSPRALYGSRLAELAFAAAAIVFAVRCGLLLPAVALNERREMLRRGWELSRGHFMKLATVGVLATVLPAALPESVGELLIGQFPALSGPMERGTLASAAEALATNDLAMVVIAVSLSLSAALSLILTTIASCLAYRRLQGIV
ncbi:MAG: hypothetical protein WDN03_09455 [Rhizomicrobium sp.]